MVVVVVVREVETHLKALILIGPSVSTVRMYYSSSCSPSLA